MVSSAAPEGVRFIEHTADFGLDVEAPSLEECFARTAAGLFSSFAEEATAAGPDERALELTLSASNLEELLVLWLEELLYRTESERVAFRAFKVDGIDGAGLHGWAAGVPGPGEPPIKGVTRHDLWVRKDGGLWRAHVILDV